MDTVEKLNFIRRIKKWSNIFVKHPFGKITILAVTFSIGFYSSSVFQIIPDNQPLERLAVISAGLAAFLIGTLSLFKTVFDLEIKTLQIDKLEKDDLKLSEVKPNKFTKEILDRIEAHWRIFDPRKEGRASHWTREKRYLAEHYVDFLSERIAQVQNSKQYKKITIIFDAGSTISPILDELGRQASEIDQHWTRNSNISIVTNNLNGVLMLLSYHDPKEKDDRHSSIPFPCEVLPGEVLSAYAATASSTTIKAIDGLKENNTYVIAVTTGNYIFLDTRNSHIAPIARTGMHPDIKTALAKTANEIHYVAPLGKVIVCNDNECLAGLCDRLNKKAEFKESSSKPSEEAYKLIFECNSSANPEDYGEWYKKSILVTTSRPDGTFLHTHSIKVGGASLKTYGNIPTMSIKDGPYRVNWLYDQLPKIIDEQIDIEVPHSYLRSFWTEFFDA